MSAYMIICFDIDICESSESVQIFHHIGINGTLWHADAGHLQKTFHQYASFICAISDPRSGQ